MYDIDIFIQTLKHKSQRQAYILQGNLVRGSYSLFAVFISHSVTRCVRHVSCYLTNTARA
jgi:hypothetical protein